MIARTARRTALALTDLLLLIVLLAFLAGFVMALISKMRDDAEEQLAINHLKQIALAAQDYHDTFMRLPGNGVGGVKDDSLVSPQDYRTASFWYQILPYLGQDAFFRNPTATKNVTIKTYLLPERKRSGVIGERAATDFAVNFMALYGVEPPKIKQVELTGTMTMAAYPDGTSNTFIAAGKALRPKEYESDKADASFLLLRSAGLSKFSTRYTAGVKPIDELKAEERTPFAFCDSDDKLPAGPSDAYGGPDPEVLAIAMVDGSVRKVTYAWLSPDKLVKAPLKPRDANSKTVEVSQFRAALTPNGNEIVTFE